MKVNTTKRVGITALLVILIFFITFMVSISLSGSRGPDSMAIDNQGQEISYVFVRYQQQVYALVPSNGYYLVNGADAATFRMVDDSYQNRQFGVDKNHAYCGNLVVRNFNPATARAIGNDYFTDGKQTCYCATISVRNEALSIPSELTQRSLYGFGLGGKPQTYIYPFSTLDTGPAPYHAMLKAPVVTNGALCYYQGKILPEANAAGLRQVAKWYNDGDTRESQSYLADGQHVYYENTRLPLKDDPGLHAIVIDAQNQENYLVDPKHGLVYVNDIPFDPQYGPYQVLSLNGGHIYHALFLSKHGIFYFDKSKKKVLRIQNNPFNNGRFKEIAPLVFSDGRQILYTEARQVWGRRKSPGLKSESTSIYRLEEPTTGTWQKTGMVNGNSGSVWKNGNTYYYFDQLGISQLIPHTIYRIMDQATVTALLSPEMGADDIRKLVVSDHLAKVKRTELVEVETKFSGWWAGYAWIVLGMFGVIQFILWILRKAGINPKPFYIKDQRLRVNSLLGSSYALADISAVVFTIETSGMGKGYAGRFQIQTKSGKSSRKYMFTTQMRLNPDTRQELELYIADLEQLLKLYKVNSVVRQ